MPVGEKAARERFERDIVPHLDSAYSLARWLTDSPADAEDAVQEAFLRALRFFGGYRGENSRAWLLAIVRNTCASLRQKRRPDLASEEFDEEVHTPEPDVPEAEGRLLREADTRAVGEALAGLSPRFREVLVLREIEGCSYKEIGSIAGVPVGTVMSRLARARAMLRDRMVSARKGA